MRAGERDARFAVNEQRVGSAAAGQIVVARSAIDRVVTVSAGDHVVARSAGNVQSKACSNAGRIQDVGSCFQIDDDSQAGDFAERHLHLMHQDQRAGIGHE